MKLYRRYFLVCDLIICSLAAIAIGIWIEAFGGAKTLDGLLNGNRGTIYGTMASVLGALLGFIIATLAILIAVLPDERLARVRASGQYPVVWRTLTSAMRWLAVGTFLSLVTLVADRDSSPVRWLELLTFWAWLVGVTRVAWSVWIVERLVKLLATRS